MTIRSVRAQLLLVSALCGLLGVAMTATLYHLSTRQRLVELARPALADIVERGELARCEESPASWKMDGPGRAKTWSYDLDGHAANAWAPPLDDDDLARARATEVGDVAVALRGFFRGGVVLARPTAGGPCAITASYWTPVFPQHRLFALILLLGGGLGIAGSFVVGLAGIAPLARRIARVRRAAMHVGEPGKYESAEPDAKDDLGKVSAELDRAHERLVAYAARAEASRRDLQRHLANVAHDLRTPITSLQLSLEQAIGAKDDPAQLDRLLTGAVRDLVYLGGLTANLRLASELEEGWSPATSGSTSLTDAVVRATTRVELLARRRGIALDMATPDAPVLVPCDPTAIERAVANVVENAVIHGGPEGHVAVVLRTPASGGFELMVLDDGPGVTPEEIPRLGERTFRADGARKRDARGSGLGLAITREVCARCGWELGFAREEPRGLRVTMRGRIA